MVKTNGQSHRLSEWFTQIASATGYGGYRVQHGNVIAYGQWSCSEAAQSSTWHELRAVRMVLESF